MFEKLFTKPAIIARHKAAPFPEERRRYLLHYTKQGYTIATIRNFAWDPRQILLSAPHERDIAPRAWSVSLSDRRSI